LNGRERMSVIKLPAATTYTVEQALDDAKQMNLNDVPILGVIND
jgi:hypothetical protein